MFVGPTGKPPTLLSSHHPLTTPTGGQQPCGAHGVYFPPPFSTLTNRFNSITTHDQFTYSIHPPLHIPSTPLSPCDHRHPACVITPNELPLISQTIHTLPNPTLFANSAYPILIGGQQPAISQTAPVRGTPPPSISLCTPCPHTHYRT